MVMMMIYSDTAESARWLFALPLHHFLFDAVTVCCIRLPSRRDGNLVIVWMDGWGGVVKRLVSRAWR